MAGKVRPYKVVSSAFSTSKYGVKMSTSHKRGLRVSTAKIVTSINRIGETVSSIGSIVEDMRDFYHDQIETMFNIQQDLDRSLQLEKDQDAEEEAEGGGPKTKEATDESKKELEKKSKKKGLFGWLEDFLKPWENIASFLARAFISRAMLKWFADEKNLKKLENIIETIGKVGKFAMDLAAGSIGLLMDGLGSVFGGIDKVSNGKLGGAWDMIKGLGGVIAGVAGLKALGYLLNPFSLISDIMGILDAINQWRINRRKPKLDTPDGNKPKVNDVDTPDGKTKTKTKVNDGKVKVTGTVDDITDATIDAGRKVQITGDVIDKSEDLATTLTKNSDKIPKTSWWDNIVEGTKKGLSVIGDIPGNLKKAWQSAYKWLNEDGLKMLNEMSEAARKRWDEFAQAAAARRKQSMGWWDKLSGKVGDFKKWVGEGVEGAKKGATEWAVRNIVEPLGKFFEPILKPIQNMGKQLVTAIEATPAGKMVAEQLKKRGLSLAEPGPLIKKIGGKALPVVGGLLNALFAYDALSNGDPIGAALEALSGAFDISGLFGFVPGPMISLGIDAYLFGRELVPPIRELEDKAFNALPGIKHGKKFLEQIGPKLPKGPIEKLLGGLMGGGEEEVEEKAIGGILKNVKLSTDKIFNGIKWTGNKLGEGREGLNDVITRVGEESNSLLESAKGFISRPISSIKENIDNTITRIQPTTQADTSTVADVSTTNANIKADEEIDSGDKISPVFLPTTTAIPINTPVQPPVIFKSKLNAYM